MVLPARGVHWDEPLVLRPRPIPPHRTLYHGLPADELQLRPRLDKEVGGLVGWLVGFVEA